MMRKEKKKISIIPKIQTYENRKTNPKTESTLVAGGRVVAGMWWRLDVLFGLRLG
jgi:hypothetical protein